MVVIIGGAYQGKLDFAIEKYGVASDEIITCNAVACSEPACSEISNCESGLNNASIKIINCYQLLVLGHIKNGADHLSFIKDNLQSFKDRIIICDDIFCGVVPIEPQARLYRETLGRALTFLSREADEVYRVFCGLGTKIK